MKEPIPVIPTCHYMMGGIPTKVTGQALTVNEQGEDVVILACSPSAKLPAYQSTVPTVWAATPA